jgi:hypothetical protein
MSGALETYVDSSWITLGQKVEISGAGSHGTKGRDGQAGQDGLFPGGTATSGANGVTGQQGGHAQPITIALKSVSPNAFLLMQEDTNTTPMVLPLHDPGVSMVFDASGGNGGAGGVGGNGGKGAEGQRGEDATRERTGTSGMAGGSAGNGGNGENGGNGGNAAPIKVYLYEEDMDLCAAIDACHVHGGVKGAGGDCGIGGLGGAGGKGGASYAWQEERVSFDRDGQRVVSYERRMNPGGHDGARGAGGQNGNRGQSGQDGKPSFVQFTVFNGITGQMRVYNRTYHLEALRFDPLVSDDGIIEPGESVNINNLVVRNSGGMPTPIWQGVFVGVEANQSVSFSHRQSGFIGRSIGVGAEYQLEGPVGFSARHADTPAGQIFYRQASIALNARLDRIDRYLPSFHQKAVVYDVRYPVELSVSFGGHTVLEGTNVPVALKVRNISSKGLGLESETGRNLVVTLALQNPNDGAELINFLGNQSNALPYSLAAPLRYHIPNLPPHSELTIGGTLSVDVRHFMAYARIPLSWSLELEKVNHRQLSTSAIQEEGFELQIAEPYHCADGTADMLLVTNSQTTALEVERWKKLADRLGMHLDHWNVSVYGGVDYRYPSYHFREKFAGKVVVFLNTPFCRDDDPAYFETPFYAAQYLAQYELFEAARRSNVSTYVLNGDAGFDFAKAIVPSAPIEDYQSYDSRDSFMAAKKQRASVADECLPEQHEAIRVTKQYLFISPSEKKMRKKVERLSQSLARLEPQHSYGLHYAYDAKPLGRSWLRRVFDYGEIVVRRGLDRSRSHLAVRPAQFNDARFSQDEIDAFVFFKLLPFTKKLSLLTQVVGDEQLLKSLGLSIVSDLTQEQSIFYHQSAHTVLSKPKLRASLYNLQAFRAHDFRMLLEQPQGHQMLLELLTKYLYLSGFRSNRLTRLCRGEARALLKEYLPSVSDKQMKASRQQIVAQERLPNRVLELEQRFIDPLQLKACGVQFDNDLTRTSPDGASVVAEKTNTSEISEQRFIYSEDALGEEKRRGDVSFFAKHAHFKKSPPVMLYGFDKQVRAAVSVEPEQPRVAGLLKKAAV